MAGTANELLEMILRECEAAGDKPWYPSEYAEATGVDRAPLDASLDDLRVGGLVRLTEWERGKGQGYALTEEGHEVLHSSRLLNQLRQRGAAAVPVRARPESSRAEDTPRSWDRAKALSDALLSHRPALVTRTLIALNVANFGIGMLLALQASVPLTEFVAWSSPDPRVYQIHTDTGAMAGRISLLRGEWWRLITTCFVHPGGAIHLLMNMFALASLGPMLEKVLGHFRFAILYLFSGLGGSLAAVYFSPLVGAAGASGAICGLLGALFAWVWLNRNYLRNAGDLLRNIMTNIVLIVFISFVPGVSAAGHFGGGVAGLLMTVPLNFSRYGTGAERWLGLAGTVGLLLLGVGGTFFVAMPQSELEHARLYYLPKILEVDRISIDTSKEFVTPALNDLRQGSKLPEDKRKTLVAEIDRTQEKLSKLEEELAQPRQYADTRINAALGIGLEYAQKWKAYFAAVKSLVGEDGNLNAAASATLSSLNRRLDELQEQLAKSIFELTRN